MHKLSFILLVIGGLNWLLVGLFKLDIGILFSGGQAAAVSRIIYVRGGLAAVQMLISHKKLCKECMPGGSTSSGEVH